MREYRQDLEDDDSMRFQLIKAELRCPITQEIMRDPVVTYDGHTFQRNAIEGWFQRGHATNPITNLPLTTLALHPNLSVRNIVQNLPILQRAIHQQKKKDIEGLLKAIEEMWMKETPTGISQIKREKNALMEENQDLKQFLKNNQRQCKNKLLTQQIDLARKDQTNNQLQLEVKTLRNVLLSLKQQLEEMKQENKFLNQKLQNKTKEEAQQVHKRTTSKSFKVEKQKSVEVENPKLNEGFYLGFYVPQKKRENITEYSPMKQNQSRNSLFASRQKSEQGKSARYNPESKKNSAKKLDRKRQTISPANYVLKNAKLTPIKEKPSGSSQQLIKKQSSKPPLKTQGPHQHKRAFKV